MVSYQRSDNAVDGLASGLQVISSPIRRSSTATFTHTHTSPSTTTPIRQEGRKRHTSTATSTTFSTTCPWPLRSSPCLHNQTFLITFFSVCPPGRSVLTLICCPSTDIYQVGRCPRPGWPRSCRARRSLYPRIPGT